MNTTQHFNGAIFRDLDQKLKTSDWNSGACEAHGLLCALACRGVAQERLRGKAWLFQLGERDEQNTLAVLEGMYGLILRDLRADGFQFNLLLPDDSFTIADRIESLADWCAGFMQGIFHDNWGAPDAEADVPDRVREAIDDIITISRVSADVAGLETEERDLLEISEYLRVAVQIVFDELTVSDDDGDTFNLPAPVAGGLH